MRYLLTISLLLTALATYAQDSTRHTDYDKIFTKLEIEASYPGGPAAWLRFLNKNMHFPQEAMDDNTLSGTVIVQFIVDTAGHISDIQATSGPEEFHKEAVRLIKLSGIWVPGIQNGRNVKSYKRQPITIELARQ
jgi:protein TonB